MMVIVMMIIVMMTTIGEYDVGGILHNSTPMQWAPSVPSLDPGLVLEGG